MFQKIIIEQAWYYLVLCAGIALGVAWWLYARHRQSSDVSPQAIRWLTAFRAISLFLLLCLLLSIFVKTQSHQTEQPQILLAIDNSGSMRETADSGKLAIKALESLESEIGSKFDLRRVLFGASVSNAQTPMYTEKETDLSALLKDLETNFSNSAVGAVVVISDGVYNKGVNPVYTASDFPFKIISIGAGDTTEKSDLAIRNVNHNDVVYAGNTFPVEVQVNASKLSSKTASLQLFSGNKPLQSKVINLNANKPSQIVTFTLQAETAGIQRFDLLVSSNDKETNLKNNAATFVVEVIETKQKIVLVATAPHPDIAALRDAVARYGNYELEEYYYTEKPATLKGCNLVIIHGFDRNSQNLLASCMNEKIPYWIIQPKQTEGIGTFSISSSIPRSQQIEAIVRNEFFAFTLSEQLKNFLAEAPALNCPLGKYHSVTGNQLLLSQKINGVETDLPLFYFNESGDQKSAVFIGDGLWRWRLNDFEKNHNSDLFNELISKSIQYLSVKSDKSNFRVKAPRLVSENDNVEIVAEVYNKTYELITNPEVVLALTAENKTTFNYTFSKLNNSYRLDLGKLAPGKYAYKAQVIINGETVVREGNFAVTALTAERSGESANHVVLRQISQQTNGKFFALADYEKAADFILSNNSIKPITYTQTKIAPITELKWLFWIIVFLLSIEWWFRKRFFGI